MGKYINDLILPLGDDAAAFAKVAAADQMGRDLAKLAGKEGFIASVGNRLENVRKSRKTLGRVNAATAERGLNKSEKLNIGAADSIAKEKATMRAAAESKGYVYKTNFGGNKKGDIKPKFQQSYDAMPEVITGKKNIQGIVKKTRTQNKNINKTKGTQAAKQHYKNTAPAGKARKGGSNPAPEGEKGKGVFDDAEWYKSKRIWTGAGIGAGGALLGSAALGN
ncbi:MAG: hypothetical protein H8D23_06600 [Candidatus Brocadiales bacterium]|nr:hypothetical protein [Candidatus Brocadiales bacterium]